MQQRHANHQQYFREQAQTTKKYVIPFIESVKSFPSPMQIAEIGCGDAGNLLPFLDKGHFCTGIDIDQNHIDNAHTFFAEHPYYNRLELICNDIYNVSPDNRKYDIIILRDVIEHIHNQECFIHFLKQFLKPDGVIFFGFPAWYMPFGGHQQVCNGTLSKMPFIHLLPARIYAWLLKRCGNEKSVKSLLEIKETGITLERFERILKHEQYHILRKEYWLIQPNYEIKFHLRIRQVPPLLRSLPYLRDFYTTAGYYVVGLSQNTNT